MIWGLGVIVAMIAAVWLFWMILYPVHTYRYKLTVEVETPDGLRTGSAVREVTWQDGPQITPEASMAGMSQKGEAVTVELPKGKLLFALLSPSGHETPKLAFGSSRQTKKSNTTPVELSPLEKSEAVYGESGYPRLVTFADINDPKSVAKVDPANLAASFGEGYRLKYITAQISEEPVTTGIEERLSWLRKLNGGYLHGGSTARGAPLGLVGLDFNRIEK